MKFTFRQLKEQVIYHISYVIGLITGRKLMGFYKSVGEEYHDIDRIVLDDNSIVKSNKWGMFKIPEKFKSDYMQFIGPKGWIFCTPSKNYGVIGYPSITYHNNPIMISDIKSYQVTYDSTIEIEKNRRFNTSFDFWLSKNDTFSFPTITHEIMIWDNYFVSKPFGKYKGEINVNGNKYRIYIGYIDKSSENLGVDGWMYICFLNINRTESNKIDIKKMLDYLINNGHLSKEHYLLRSEFGNEIYNASGHFTINDLQYNIK